MPSSTPRVSVIVPAYRPGDGIDRVIASLDAQTLPQDQFETIIVDDGSPDSTFTRLQRIAATRPNMRVLRIENSGWPSRPRNVATELARGEYVFFMDHDDSIYPDALRRATEYAAQNGADILSPKESKTSDVWWGIPALEDGNIPNALVEGGIDRLLPMVPHKFYRREFLLQHGIRFPEGRRALWEDIYQNVEAYRHAKVVSVLADTPVYLWHSSATNNSKTYGPADTEFWDRLDDLTAFIDRTLDTPAYADARRSALLHQYRSRVLARTARILSSASPAEIAFAGDRAGALQRRWIPAEWDALLGKQDQARAFFLREGRLDLLRELQDYDSAISGIYEGSDVLWTPAGLRLSVRAGLQRAGGPLPFRIVGPRVLRDLPRTLASKMPSELLDVTDEADSFVLRVGVRDRAAKVTWSLPGGAVARFERLDADTVTIAAGVDTIVDPFHGAEGGPLEPAVYDAYGMSQWMGGSRGAGIRYSGTAHPAMLGERGAIAYANTHQRLSIDLAQRFRSVVKDGQPAVERAEGTVSSFTMPLPAITVTHTGSIPTRVDLVPVSDALRRTFENFPMTGPIARLMTGSIEAQIVADENGDAQLVGGGEVRPGDYRMSFAAEGEDPLVSSLTMSVHRDGSVEFGKKPIKPRRGK